MEFLGGVPALLGIGSDGYRLDQMLPVGVVE